MDLAGAIIGHMVGDYLLQTDYMAENKKKSSFTCMVHCCIWTCAVMLFGGMSNAWAFLFLLVTHFIQDRTNIIRWSMSFLQSNFSKPPLAPWSLIVVDNTWHLVQIWIAYTFIA